MKKFSSWLRDDVEEEKAQLEGKRETGEEESKSWKREVEREEEKTAIKRRCVHPISEDVVDELRPMVESERVGDSCGDGYGTSVCGPAVSSCVFVVTGVLVSSSVVRVFGVRIFFRVLTVSWLSRSTFLSQESVETFSWKVKVA